MRANRNDYKVAGTCAPRRNASGTDKPVVGLLQAEWPDHKRDKHDTGNRPTSIADRDVIPLPEDLLQRLAAAARLASAHAYAPYSRFRVGAACVAGSGRVYSGANVENASYGLSICAERNTLFQAVAAGERDISAIVVYTPTPAPTTPCGACRQVLCEFGAAIRVVCCCDGDEVREFASGELLPDRFQL